MYTRNHAGARRTTKISGGCRFYHECNRNAFRERIPERVPVDLKRKIERVRNEKERNENEIGTHSETRPQRVPIVCFLLGYF